MAAERGFPGLRQMVLDCSGARALAEFPLRVYADPAGHPFCILVVHGG